MKNKTLLFLFIMLFSVHTTYVKQNKHVSKKMKSANSLVSTKCCGFDAPPVICCKRGKRGDRGPRGPHGFDGTYDAGRNELFINALMMAWVGDETYPPNERFIPYREDNSNSTVVFAWSLEASEFDVLPVGANFVVPIDLDVTQPVTAVIHLLVSGNFIEPIEGDQAKLQIQTDYKPSITLLGTTPPATGFAAVQNSADFTVTQPPANNTEDMIQLSVSVPLDTTNMHPGDWAFITVGRIAPATNEYQSGLHLSTISIQYTRQN